MTSEPRPALPSSPRRGRSALWHLTWVRLVTFLREPEAVFWVFAFPVLMSVALGIAFRSQKPAPSPVAVEAGPRADSLAAWLARSPELAVTVLPPDAARAQLRRGKIAVVVRADASGRPVLAWDPTRPETRLAHLAALDALERGAGRADRLGAASDTAIVPGARYIDFLVPGLLGLNLMGTGMWGVGFPVATARQQKLLKRLLATPMRRTDYLLSLMLARLVWLVLEVAFVLGFAMLFFGVEVRGSWTAFTVVSLAGTFAFTAIGLLTVSRAETIEAVSGLMNFVMLPMWLLSGSFFPAERFPQLMQPVVQALPLTAINNALRAIMNEGAGFPEVAIPLAILGAWGAVTFVLALRWFRWE